ncbi:MAG: polyprenyl synthetase family protein [Clostridium sp.]|jgi:geranylgeranyl diphosphate synthase type II|nr:polyprenyl synthetase family protein [Clostridium sp.]
MDQTFDALLTAKKEEIEAILTSFLPPQEVESAILHEAFTYSLMAGGKRLRPMLMQSVYELYQGSNPALRHFMAAIEMIHTYSLVHDDLPAMDNDEFRRGKKTTHAKYGEAFAILAGDALLNYAFETVHLLFGQKDELSALQLAQICDCLVILARKSGLYGMIGGQTADLLAERSASEMKDPVRNLQYIHENKTAALLEASMMIGACLAGCDTTQIQQMEACARLIGVAFQIQDDVLDVIGDQDTLGKEIGSDARNGKTTYVTLYGLTEAIRKSKEMVNQALHMIADSPGDHLFLTTLVEHLIDRQF